MSSGQIAVVAIGLAWLTVRSLDGERSVPTKVVGYVFAALLVACAITGRMPLG